MATDEGASDLNARPLEIDQLIAYRKGATVSSTILTKEAGTVTLFSFDAGQGMSEHTAPYDALLLMLDGEAKVVIADISHAVKAGEFIIMPANEPHSVQALQRFKMMLVMVRS